MSPVIKPHWHIDYLRQRATIEAIWYLAHEPKPSVEHEWAAALSTLPEVSVIAPRFGASDCQCETHLLHFTQQPDFDAFCGLIGTSLQQYTIS
jgi:Uri superfamily endonuclease